MKNNVYRVNTNDKHNYSQPWWTGFLRSTMPNGQDWLVELKKHNGQVDVCYSYINYRIEFDTEEDFLIFKLKFS